MAIHKDLLDILVCPETKEPVALIDEDERARINEKIEAGTAKRRNGEPETEPIDAGLLRQDGKYLYAVRDDIPVMLIDEAIDMASVNA